MHPPAPAHRRTPAAVGPRVVGMGASAGGLIALEQFLAQVPPGSGLAYVVVQHLDPNHKAMLVELLQRASAMPVQEARHGARLEADQVYVIAPNSELTVAGGVLHLATPAQPRGLRLPIDLMLSSLARDQGERAIGVVLSGMGADGTLGLQAIKSQGGLTLAQDPASAQFDSMPQSAMAAACVDIVALPAEMPAHILRVTGQPPAGETRVPAAPAAPESGSLDTLLTLLRQRSRHDLSDYKPSTLRRRIERRMAVHGLATTADYEAFVRQNPQELDLLFKEMLIGVTRFFRDPEVWVELKDTVIPALLQRSAEGARLRAWVVGCSTGEEAYSLAMVFQEVASQLPGLPRKLQIFASDLSADAIAAARKGAYPMRIAGEVDADRLARFFVPHDNGYVLRAALREMVLFAQHDVILDPPFTRLDLLSCRNLLIYFDPRLQRRLLPLFGYSLRPGGALVLGSSETVGAGPSPFVQLGAKSRIYWRDGPAIQPSAVDFPVGGRTTPPRITPETPLSQPTTASPAQLQTLAEQALLQAFSPPAVLVNDAGDVVYVNGRIGRYLEPASGKANWNIHVMARPPLRAPIAAALRQSLVDGKAVHLRGQPLEEGSPDAVDITVQALQEPKALTGLVMVVFRDVPPVTPARRRRKAQAGAADAALAEETLRWREEARALRQEMTLSAEELQAANEELQSTNEELQSANEELTTSKEEAQSMNEELQTLNGELQSKLDDLALAQSDMQNLLNSTDIATLFLDNELNVRRYTDQITRIISLREGDVGRPLTDLSSTLVYPALNADAIETLRTLSFSEKEITTTDGLWFLVRIMPYRTVANVIHGVVITFIDITAAKALESRLRQA